MQMKTTFVEPGLPASGKFQTGNQNFKNKRPKKKNLEVCHSYYISIYHVQRSRTWNAICFIEILFGQLFP